jgi:hypothetical protein
MPSYTLGRDYTVSGLTGVSDLTVTRDGERIDVTTRGHAKPIKQTVAGFEDVTFECTVLAEGTTSFIVGNEYAITVAGGGAMNLVCMKATREEPQAGVINYKLSFRKGTESEVADQVTIGPGTYRS